MHRHAQLWSEIKSLNIHLIGRRVSIKDKRRLKFDGFLLVILCLQMTEVVFLEPVNGGLLSGAQYVVDSARRNPKTSAEHSGTYLWYWACKKLNSSLIRSIDSTMFSLKGGGGAAWLAGPPGTWKLKIWSLWKITLDDKQARFNKDSGLPKAPEYCFLRRSHEKRKKYDGSQW